MGKSLLCLQITPMQWLLLRRPRVTYFSKGKCRDDSNESIFSPTSLIREMDRKNHGHSTKKSHAPTHRIKKELSIQSVSGPGKVSWVGGFCQKQQCRWDHRRNSLLLEHPIIPISFTLSMTTKWYIFLVHLYILRHQHLKH